MKLVYIFCNGSRGDCEPGICLAQHMIKNGYSVRIYCNDGNLRFFTSWLYILTLFSIIFLIFEYFFTNFAEILFNPLQTGTTELQYDTTQCEVIQTNDTIIQIMGSRTATITIE